MMNFTKDKSIDVAADDSTVRLLTAEKSKNVLKAILANADPATWYPDAPKIRSIWEPFDLCDLRESNLSNQRIGEVMLAECMLDGSDFSNSLLEKTMLQAATASGAKFLNARLRLTQMIPFYGEKVNFNGAVFDQAAMSFSKILDSSFVSSTLNDVSLSSADVSRSSFIGVNAESCRLDCCVMRDADLSKANFSNCDLSRAVFQNTHMKNTILKNCDMSGTDFRGANLDGAKINGGTFGVVQQGDVFTPTRFDDTPQARKLVAESKADSIESIEWHPAGTVDSFVQRRVPAGMQCTHDGFWFTPAQVGTRRYFKAGQVMPEIKSDYGATIWQWDTNQEMPKL